MENNLAKSLTDLIDETLAEIEALKKSDRFAAEEIEMGHDADGDMHTKEVAAKAEDEDEEHGEEKEDEEEHEDEAKKAEKAYWKAEEECEKAEHAYKEAMKKREMCKAECDKYMGKKEDKLVHYPFASLVLLPTMHDKLDARSQNCRKVFVVTDLFDSCRHVALCRCLQAKNLIVAKTENVYKSKEIFPNPCVRIPMFDHLTKIASISHHL